MSQAGRQSITPALPRALPQAARRKVEAAVEARLAAVTALTAFLDEADGDPDLEPSLANASGDDREYDPADPPAHEGIDDNELDGPEGIDDEYELGWPEQVNQDRALNAGGNSASVGRDQWVAAADGEPSLGSLDGEINQAKWSWGNRSDLEEQCEDEGHDSDREPDTEADREPRAQPFELNQAQEGRP